ncbi:hypothetical protein GCM10010988_17800 [Cnuibacter physcomitrellae]|uniref:Uncharacterized protein n=1 Tax=Cnuibacter physcomitrellae TaxID=1619308 RepID=A0A1X9LMT3_9MICO|nr:hypothetical protein [Cnuibacter physcomitrellae]ARJ06516.1 hypothetical protein B5808_15790 [Cnuibacter physcomitrellae]GGI38199.1 hypothetical protein GCM10010988_17800 [Cnuibacter physcomitrellae]
MTHPLASDPRRATRLWRITSVIYLIGLVDFLVAFVLIFVAYFLSADVLSVIALYMFIAAWPVLFVAAVLDVLRHR